jgi:acyl-CoA thioester hydrolase
MAPTTWTYRVIYGDTDQSGVVYHANFIRWFEAARCEYLRVRGASYDAMSRAGANFPVVEVRCRYLRPARFEDEIRVEIEMTEIKRATVRFAYRVRVGDDPAPVAEGWTLHGCTDAGGRLVRIPDDVREAVARDPD